MNKKGANGLALVMSRLPHVNYKFFRKIRKTVYCPHNYNTTELKKQRNKYIIKLVITSATLFSC